MGNRTKRLLAAIFTALAAAIMMASSAIAEKRIALVIGNSNYRNVASLPNPANDAGSVAEIFGAARFDVVESRRDIGIGELRRVLGDFSDVASGADIAVVYFAGHGIEVDGTNYLIPVDARLARDFDVEDEAVSLDRVLKAIEPARRLRLVILDACRDNPFVKTMKRGVASRSIGRGLAKVEPTVSETLIAFAAKAGSVALDGERRNSPFTTALINHLATPGLDIRIAFGKVRDDVLAATGRRQEPFVYGSLGGDIVSIVGGSEKAKDKTAALDPQPQPLREVASLPPMPGPSLESLARHFLEDYMRRSEGSLPDVLNYVRQTFAAEVSYYGKRLSNLQIVEDQRRYVTRWPQRTFRLKPETTRIICDDASATCHVSGELEFSALNPKAFKVSAGVSSYEFKVTFGREGPRIVEENGQVLSRANQ